jgi:hypothetical protein
MFKMTKQELVKPELFIQEITEDDEQSYQRLHKISEHWAGVLYKKKQPFGEMDICNCQYCVVGEAWNWSGKYADNIPNRCVDCYTYSGSFIEVYSKRFGLHDVGKRNEIVNGFCDHFEDAHLSHQINITHP